VSHPATSHLAFEKDLAAFEEQLVLRKKSKALYNKLARAKFISEWWMERRVLSAPPPASAVSGSLPAAGRAGSHIPVRIVISSQPGSDYGESSQDASPTPKTVCSVTPQPQQQQQQQQQQCGVAGLEPRTYATAKGMLPLKPEENRWRRASFTIGTSYGTTPKLGGPHCTGLLSTGHSVAAQQSAPLGRQPSTPVGRTASPASFDAFSPPPEPIIDIDNDSQLHADCSRELLMFARVTQASGNIQ
jgi:hypothetical protein